MAKGFADLHNHQFANLGFGGLAFWGSPSGPIDTALPWCTPAHGPGGVSDAIGNVMKAMYGSSLFGHHVGGNPQFDGWPRWDSVTHQSVHIDWLQRAWEGGLRLMVMLAVNNEHLAGLANRAPGRSADDMEAVDLQLQAAVSLEAAVDTASGGPGKGWYRIVRTPAEARRAIDQGKLAVVLGIEVDYPFRSHPGGPASRGIVRDAVGSSSRRECATCSRCTSRTTPSAAPASRTRSNSRSTGPRPPRVSTSRHSASRDDHRRRHGLGLRYRTAGATARDCPASAWRWCTA